MPRAVVVPHHVNNFLFFWRGPFCEIVYLESDKNIKLTLLSLPPSRRLFYSIGIRYGRWRLAVAGCLCRQFPAGGSSACIYSESEGAICGRGQLRERNKNVPVTPLTNSSKRTTAPWTTVISMPWSSCDTIPGIFFVFVSRKRLAIFVFSHWVAQCSCLSFYFIFYCQDDRQHQVCPVPCRLWVVVRCLFRSIFLNSFL